MITRGVSQFCAATGRMRRLGTMLVALQLAACGGGADNKIEVTSIQQGPTPFIAHAELMGPGLRGVTHLGYYIEPKAGSATAPVHVRYSLAALQRKGNVTDDGTVTIKVPIFGLYPGYANNVSFELEFQDRQPTRLSAELTTPAYTDPNGLYDRPNVLQKRAPGVPLDFDFFVVKSALGSPVILDTDGEIRWVADPPPDNSQATIIRGDGFLVGDRHRPVLYQLGFDGSLSQSTLPDPTITNFHHNIDGGKRGVLAEVDATVNGVSNVESILVELAPDGSIIQKWDLAAIVGDYMRAQGDDPSLFVRPGYDWFHMNAATYDPRDDSIIVSGREDFLIKLDYSTGNIRWVFGDPHKYWYTFESLRAKALSLKPGGVSPIGQHAVSITANGLMMIFNDGLGSRNQPAGAPAGDDLFFSPVVAYSIDDSANTATEVWEFDYGGTIYSPICSSAYESAAGGRSILVDYSVADNITATRLVGLDNEHNVVFDFEYPTIGCNTAWNATPIAFDNLEID
jgi:arylsulfate sulfotransferase